ncbi:uncharacterized protein [Littorina saxatilis]|uniref:ZP domain-containing protein n=1 Tax=Littorina saxatilis TaxID=31220 RepID=A0AAN9AI10_9CAEN
MVAAAVLVLFLASSLIGNTFAQDENCDPVNSRTFEDFDVTIQTGTSLVTGIYSGSPGFRARIDLGLRETTDTNFPFVALDLQISLVDVDVLEIRFKFGGGLPNNVKRYENPNDTVSVVLSDLTEPVLTIVIVAFPAPDTNNTVQFTIDKLESCINPPIVFVTGDANFTTICSSESLTVEVAVTENFTGLVYPENFVNNETCAYINMTDQNYVMTFFFNSTDCGAGWQVKETFVEYSVKTIVQFNKDALYPTDRSHLSRCVFDNTFYIKDFVKTDTDNPQLREGNDTTMGNVTSFLFFGIQDPNNNALSSESEVSVGQVVNLRVQLKDNSVFSTVLVKNCIASNRPDRISFKYVWLQLIDDDGCPATDVLVPEAPVYAESNGDLDVTVKVKAFLFLEGRDDGRNELHFACDAMLCPAGNNSCAQPSCPSSRRRRSVVGMEELVLHGQGYNRNDLLPSLRAVRRRRAVEEDGNNVVTMGGSIKVVLDNERQASEVEAGAKADLAHYMQHPEVQAIIVVLCLLLLVLIVISITLAVILHRRNRRRKPKEADDVMSTTSSVRKMITPTTFIPHVQAFANPLPIYGPDAYSTSYDTSGSSSSLSSTKKVSY